MKFNELNVSSHKSRTRVGRGISAGKGKTAGRGTKGQKSRTGHGKKEGFEGGQTPVVMRLPKLRGFRSLTPKAETVYTGQLSDVKGDVTNQSLFDAGLISTPFGRVKVVLRGEVKKAVSVSLQGASATAIEAIQKAGGSFKKIDRPQRLTSKQDK